LKNKEKPMKIVRSNEGEWNQFMDRGKFSGRRKALGGERLSCGLWELPPGKRSFPMHMHHATEEAMFVVSGSAKVRTPEGETPIGPGDFVSFPPGGVAHQLVNDGSEPMIYLAMSAGVGLDVVEYPESGKIAASIGAAGSPSRKRYIFRASQQADYFEGED
jgi:uncharacterized cupin superfamily protein